MRKENPIDQILEMSGTSISIERSSGPPSRKRLRRRSSVGDEGDGEAESIVNANAILPILKNLEDSQEEEEEEEEDVGEEEDHWTILREEEEEDGEEVKKDSDPGESHFTPILIDLQVLDCPVCFEPLEIPIYQCNAGHVACSTCCKKLRNKCPSCSLTIGIYRGRAMERVLEAVRIPCPNAKYGCLESFSYGERLTHESKCIFSQCPCPVRDCDFTGTYKDLYNHYSDKHRDSYYRFVCGQRVLISLRSGGIQVLQEDKEGGELIVVQRHSFPYGELVYASCIAPLASGACKFSYTLTYPLGEREWKVEWKAQMTRIQKVTDKPPVEHFVLFPSYMSTTTGLMMMFICIHRTGEAPTHH